MLKNFPFIPYFNSFFNKRSLGTRSKAFLKSTKQLKIFLLPLWHNLLTRLLMIMCASEVLFPGTKPNWLALMIFFSRLGVYHWGWIEKVYIGMKLRLFLYNSQGSKQSYSYFNYQGGRIIKPCEAEVFKSAKNAKYIPTCSNLEQTQ